MILCGWWGVQIQELTDTLSGQLISSVQLLFKCASVSSSMTVLDTGDSGSNSNRLVYWPRSRRQRSTPDWAVHRTARCWSVPGRRSGQGGQWTSPSTPALCLWSVSQLISHARCTQSVNQSYHGYTVSQLINGWMNEWWLQSDNQGSRILRFWIGAKQTMQKKHTTMCFSAEHHQHLHWKTTPKPQLETQQT